jgi:hypothetical protein
MPKTTETTTTDTSAAVEAAKLQGIEAQLIAKYGERIVPGSVRRAESAEEIARYKRKALVSINTIGLDGKPDGLTRVVATSDVFQVKHQPEVADALRKAAAKDKRAAAKAEREAAEVAAAPKGKGKGKKAKVDAAADLLGD